jgi:mono/diheme cytochrome c family protein
MIYRLRGLSGLCVTVVMLTAACGGGSSVSEPAGAAVAPAGGGRAAADPSAADLKQPNTLVGIYTAEQAQRGREAYEEICSECHQTDEWQEDLFRARWNGESVYRFWTYIYERMPNGAPPYSLPRETVSDAVAYILQLNGVPAGAEEFGSDEEAIAEHWLYWGELGG